MELISHPSLKLLVRHEGLAFAELFEEVRRIVGPRVEATHSGVDLVEISALGVTKGTGLLAVCARFGVDPAAVLAFGDMPNDLPMLALAGHSVAVANAHATVRSAADEITGSNADDGDAQVLERLVEKLAGDGSGAGP